MTETANRLWDELEDVFENERAALLRGDLSQIASISARKEGILDQLTPLLSSDGTSAPESIRKMASRNAALLTMATQGLKAAQARVVEINAAQRGLETYGPAGDRITLGTRISHLLERRA